MKQVPHSTLIVSFAALVFVGGCAGRQRPAQVERDYVVDPSRSPVAAFPDEIVPPANPTEDIYLSIGTRTKVEPTEPVQSFQSTAHSTCGWALVATGERFPSQEAAQLFAQIRELSDRRIGEVCVPTERVDSMKVDNAALRPSGEATLGGP